MADPTYEIFIGTALTMSLTALDENRLPFDLTGYTATGSVKTSATVEAVSLDLAPTIPTPASGVVLIDVDTSGMAAGQYVFDVQITASGELPIVITSGIFKFKRKATANPTP